MFFSFRYRKAAESGNTNALNNLGMMYEKGLGVDADIVQAHKWYSLAANNGLGTASVNRQRLEAQMTAEQLDLIKESARGLQADQ